jgi:hypothetical protein
MYNTDFAAILVFASAISPETAIEKKKNIKRQKTTNARKAARNIFRNVLTC